MIKPPRFQPGDKVVTVSLSGGGPGTFPQRYEAGKQQLSPEIFPEYDQVLLQVVADEAGWTNLPIITGMDFGHTDPMFVLPYGIQVKIDCERRQLAIIENAVVD